MATRVDLSIDQGTTYFTVVNFVDDAGEPLNFNGYSAESQIKRWYTSQDSVPFGASINVSTGTVTLTLTANQTGTMNEGRYVYDVVVTDASNNVSRLIEGFVTVYPGVSGQALETVPSGTLYEAYFSNT